MKVNAKNTIVKEKVITYMFIRNLSNFQELKNIIRERQGKKGLFLFIVVKLTGKDYIKKER